MVVLTFPDDHHRILTLSQFVSIFEKTESADPLSLCELGPSFWSHDQRKSHVTYNQLKPVKDTRLCALCKTTRVKISNGM